MNYKTVFGLAFGGAIALTASGSFAATTTIQPSFGAEQTVQKILDHYYSGDSVSRVDDSQDQSFDFSPFTASAKAIYAKFDQSFGYIPGSGPGNASNSDFEKVFDVSGNGFNVTSSTGPNTLVNAPTPFRFARQGTPAQGSLLASSNPLDNPSDNDHMVTYLIDDGSGDTVYALFFEDLIGGDFDFNDLAIEVRTGGSDVTPVAPTPTAALAGIAMLGGMVIRRRRRRQA